MADGDDRDTVRGLSTEDARETVEGYFARFAWDNVLDPTAVSAEVFLASLALVE